MTSLIFSLAIGLLQTLSHQPVSHADLLMPPSIASSTLHQSIIQPVAYAPTQTTVVAVVPASAFPSCKNAAGGILYVVRAQQSPTIAGNGNVPSDGPTCAPSSSYSAVGAREPLYIVPSNEDGTPSQQPCMTIATPQYYCEIPSGSLLSAFPLV